MNEDRTFRQILERNKVDGDLGVEIEIETQPDRRFPNATGFTKVHDGSLRGNAVEYVSKVLTRKETPTLIENLRKMLTISNVPVNNSVRTGVHVHVNFLEKTFDQLKTFLMLYSIVENSLMKYCGENREGNYNCLPLTNSEYVISSFNGAYNMKDLWMLDTDNLRYCAVNLRSLVVHGTVEFRALQTKPNLENIEEWINILLHLLDESDKFTNQATILERFSIEGAKEFSKSILGDFYKTLNPSEEGLMEGMRIAQDIYYGEV